MTRHCTALLTSLLLVGCMNSALAESLEAALAKAAPSANPKVIALAVHASQCKALNDPAPAQRLAVIDYSRPSTEQRLWVFDLARRTLLFQELVAHGRSSGENLATSFSNDDDSKSTSLGLYRTQAAYDGHNGYSLRMQGLEPGFNDNALARDIVIHGAPYVSADLARSNGRIGRSWGCPAVRPEIARPLIDALKDGQLVLAYYPDPQWLSGSRYLNCK
ncbi:murein L,D-transpeptidase catalytic domain family protein [Pseudomonas sp. NA-150]|uniref:murein L,D-transpeptidase catalytic domain family protein n=1 Tax=Pseudomonas sp. NA-150 TaxID=3367525 RepID=UPI0037C9E58C